MQSTTRSDSAAWSELLELAADDSGEGPFLKRVLERVSDSVAAAGAALYLEGESGYQRVMAAGGVAFPASPGGESVAAFTSLDLPGARLLLASPAADPPTSPPAELLLVLVNAAKVFKLRQQLKQRHFEVNYRGVELEALYDVGLAIASTLDLEKLCEEILLHAVSLLDARLGALYLADDRGYSLHHTFGGEARQVLGADDGAVAALLESRTPADQEVLPGGTHVLAVPIEVEGARRGLLVVADKESRRGVGPFARSDRRTLSLFANQAAIALENARLHRQAVEQERLERELELAAEIQRGLLPKARPEIEGFELFGWSRPARHVGGDYYDLMSLAGERLGMVVADVSGKGMPAALLVATLHSAVRLMLDRFEVGPGLLERLNRHLLESSAPNKFATFLLAELDSRSGRLSYLNAGHDPGILLSATGEVHKLEAGGLPLGVLPGSSYRAQALELSPGDLLCLYSDGITECASLEEEEFGLERLVELLLSCRERALPEVVAAVERATTGFGGGRPQGDDQTLLLLRRD